MIQGMCEYSERRLSANINVTQSFLFKRIKSTQFSLKPTFFYQTRPQDYLSSTKMTSQVW